MSNDRSASFHRSTMVLATFLVAACVMAAGACVPQILPEEKPTPPPTMELPTPTLTPVPTPTLACALEPVGEFREAWNSKMGCPEDEEKVVWCAWQRFERGDMLWRVDTGKIYVLSLESSKGGRWQEYDDPWVEDQYPSDIDPDIVPPPGLAQPKRGFGLIWREQLGGPRSDIGWALREEEGLCAVIQPFEKGDLFRYNPKEHSDEMVEACQVWLSEDLYKFYWPRENVRVAIILYADHSWHSYK